MKTRKNEKWADGRIKMYDRYMALVTLSDIPDAGQQIAYIYVADEEAFDHINKVLEENGLYGPKEYGCDFTDGTCFMFDRNENRWCAIPNMIKELFQLMKDLQN
jgi:hypothetical protein